MIYFLGILLQQYASICVAQEDSDIETVFFNSTKEHLLEGEPFSFNCIAPVKVGTTEEFCGIFKMINGNEESITARCNSTHKDFVARCQDRTLLLSKDAFVAATDAGRYQCLCYKLILGIKQPKPGNKSISLLRMHSFNINIPNLF